MQVQHSPPSHIQSRVTAVSPCGAPTGRGCRRGPGHGNPASEAQTQGPGDRRREDGNARSDGRPRPLRRRALLAPSGSPRLRASLVRRDRPSMRQGRPGRRGAPPSAAGGRGRALRTRAGTPTRKWRRRRLREHLAGRRRPRRQVRESAGEQKQEVMATNLGRGRRFHWLAPPRLGSPFQVPPGPFALSGTQIPSPQRTLILSALLVRNQRAGRP